MVDSIAKSIGHHGHWGFSSGFDFIEVLLKNRLKTNNTTEPIRILLINPGDIRHILLTISRKRRHYSKINEIPPIHFYLFESNMEILTREILLLQIITDYEIPIRQRSNVYLETFGNLKVQKRTSEYIESLSKQLISLSATGIGRLDHVLNFELFNYRDKDRFERALYAYSNTVEIDIDKLYDFRQRG